MTIQIGKSDADNIISCYNNLNSAREFARYLATSPDMPVFLRKDFTSIAADLTIATDRIDRRVPKQSVAEFERQVKNNDPLKLQNILRLYNNMLPEQQDMLETVAEAIIKKEFKLQEA